jgi:hypothetical protein
MARLYSTKFVDANLASGIFSIATVPTGYVWVVRWIVTDMNSASLANGVIYESGGATIWRYFCTSSDGFNSISGRWVLTAGTVLETSNPYATTIHMSGYALTTP